MPKPVGSKAKQCYPLKKPFFYSLIVKMPSKSDKTFHIPVCSSYCLQQVVASPSWSSSRVFQNSLEQALLTFVSPVSLSQEDGK